MIRDIFLRMPLVLLLLFWPVHAGILAQDTISSHHVEDTIATGIDFFGEEDPASITLIYNISDWNKHKEKYVKARLICHYKDTIDVEEDIRLKARGKQRQVVCSFPPILINLRRADTRNMQLKGMNKVKMVTHCANSRLNLNYVLKEYLAYKIYNLLSPYSFRVRLVKVKYVDTGRKNKEYDTWGFFIEPEDLLAERLDALPVKLDYLGLSQTDPEVTGIMTVFNYLIGNADYSVTSRHNVKLLRLKDLGKMNPVPVPYDFDYSGLVNAHYAIPGDNLGITSVTQRYFLGPCRSEEDFRQIFSYFFGKKEEIYQLIESFEYLDERERNWAIAYLDEFFSNAGNPGYIQKNILKTCR